MAVLVLYHNELPLVVKALYRVIRQQIADRNLHFQRLVAVFERAVFLVQGVELVDIFAAFLNEDIDLIGNIG